MSAFADAGRVIDRELEKLRQFFESDVKPTTQRKAVEALRVAAVKLAKLADQIDLQPAKGKKEGKRS